MPPPAADRLWQTARRIDVLSALRNRILGRDLFPDHAMSILLHTYLAEAEGRTTTAAAMARALDLAPVLTERWLAALTAHDLLDPVIGVDAPVQLSDAGIAQLEHLLTAASQAERT